MQVTIDIQNKKISIQELTSALKGIEAAILGRVLEEIDSVLISSICGRGYGRNEYHKHSKEERTIVTQLGKTTFSVTRVKEKSTGRTFCPLYNLIEFDERRLYQPDIAAIAVDYVLSMLKESRQRLERICSIPSHDMEEGAGAWKKRNHWSQRKIRRNEGEPRHQSNSRGRC